MSGNSGTGDNPPGSRGKPSGPQEPLKTMVTQRGPKGGRTRGVLSVTAGADPGLVLSIPSGLIVTLGRSDECTFRFDDASLSRVHARVIHVAGDYVFQDAGSTNGSYVNDRAAQQAITLRDGDRVQLGAGTTLRFSLVDEDEEAALKRVYENAMRDGLTGVYNRKSLETRLDAEVDFSLRNGTPLAVVIIDIDHFKRVNDGYGHLAGDAVLKHTAGLFLAGLRAGEFFARYGGEEFVIVFRGVDVAGARAVAERMRALVEATPIAFAGQTIKITSSAGVADLDECGAQRDKATLLGTADGRLYQAKQGGRNRVVG